MFAHTIHQLSITERPAISVSLLVRPVDNTASFPMEDGWSVLRQWPSTIRADGPVVVDTVVSANDVAVGERQLERIESAFAGTCPLLAVPRDCDVMQWAVDQALAFAERRYLDSAIALAVRGVASEIIGRRSIFTLLQKWLMTVAPRDRLITTADVARAMRGVPDVKTIRNHQSHHWGPPDRRGKPNRWKLSRIYPILVEQFGADLPPYDELV